MLTAKSSKQKFEKYEPFSRLNKLFSSCFHWLCFTLQPSQTWADALSTEIQKDLLFVCMRSSTVLTSAPTQSVTQTAVNWIKVVLTEGADQSFQYIKNLKRWKMSSTVLKVLLFTQLLIVY